MQYIIQLFTYSFFQAVSVRKVTKPTIQRALKEFHWREIQAGAIDEFTFNMRFHVYESTLEARFLGVYRLMSTEHFTLAAEPLLMDIAVKAREVIANAEADRVVIDDGNVIDLLCDNISSVSIEDLRSALVVAGLATRFPKATAPRQYVTKDTL